jgi:hypothetical protein
MSISDENVELFTTGSFQELATLIEKEWWEEKRKQLKNLSDGFDTDLIEFLPPDLQQGLLGSTQEFDEENPPEDSFLLTFKREKGKSYSVVSNNNEIIKATKKITKKEKEETIHILHSLSAEPTGSTFERPQNIKPLKRGGDTIAKAFGYTKKIGDNSKPTFYQYKCGRSLTKRLIWVIEKEIKRVLLLFYGDRAKMGKIWVKGS